MENKIKSIFYGFLSGNLSSEAFDERESAKNYAQQVRERLEVEYPGVAIEVKYVIASGCTPYSMMTSVEYENGDLVYTDELGGDEADRVRDIAQQVRETFNWFVGLEEV